MSFIRRSAAVSAACLLVFASSGVRAGCLAPFDQAVDASQGVGPFWGNDSRSLLYARKGSIGAGTLILRHSGGGAEPIAVGGEQNGFFAGTAPESWNAFHNGTINKTDDVAFVASTTIPDDPNTPDDESAVARRGAYSNKNGQRYEIARFGGNSPVADGFGGFVPWGSIFESFAADRTQSDEFRVIFNAQLAGVVDHRMGLFRWSDLSPATTTPILLAGDASPSGGAFSAIGRLRGDGAGDAVFFATTKLTDSSPDTPGIFLLPSGGSPIRVVKFGQAGDAAPHGGTFFSAGDFDVDDAGVVTFAATIGGSRKTSGLYRAAPPSYLPEVVLEQGAATPLGGSFGAFSSAIVRSPVAGGVVFSVALSDDVGGVGVFAIPAGTSAPVPLVSTDETLSLAALGGSSAAYTTGDQVRTVVPADGSQQGPTDFRVVSVDQKNAVALKGDSILFQGSFLLPPWDVAGPATFRGDATRQTPTGTISGTALTKIAEVKVAVSETPGNNFVFGIGGTDSAPIGTVKYNGLMQSVTKLVVKPDGSGATWTFIGSPGPGSLVVDLAAGTFKLSVSKATINPSYDAANFRAAFILRSTDDVSQTRPDSASFFDREVVLDGTQAPFGTGRRVVSRGEVVDGGTVYVDVLKVARKPAAGSKPAADAIQLSGTIRLCPGSIAVEAPTLPLTLHVGDLHLDAATLTRVGKTGASYRYAASGVDFRIDLLKGTFTLKATSAPLSQLVDPAGTTGTNNSKSVVGGMKLPFTLTIPLVYDVAYDVAMTRLVGGKGFSR